MDAHSLSPSHAATQQSQQQGKAIPAVAAAGAASATAAGPVSEHQFLLCPVDGRMMYVRRGANARLLESDAAQEMKLELSSISVRLAQLQYVSTQKLLKEFDRYAAGAPHRHLRPTCRPASGGGKRQSLYTWFANASFGS
jgi:hypothetical protein